MAVARAADLVGDFRDRQGRLPQQVLRAFDAALDDVAVRRHARRLAERVGEMTGTQRDGTRDGGKGQRVAKVLFDVVDGAPQLVR